MQLGWPYEILEQNHALTQVMVDIHKNAEVGSLQSIGSLNCWTTWDLLRVKFGTGSYQ